MLFKHPIYIITALSRNVFKKAVKRGVKIRIPTNSLASTDNVEAFSSYQTDREKLLETGVRIYKFRPDAAERTRIMTGELQETLQHKPIFGHHAKSMVIDEKTTLPLASLWVKVPTHTGLSPFGTLNFMSYIHHSRHTQRIKTIEKLVLNPIFHVLFRGRQIFKFGFIKKKIKQNKKFWLSV